MTVLDALQAATRYLKDRKVPNPRLDSELMLASVLDCDRVALLAHPETALTPAQEARFRSWTEKRGEHYPLQYLRGVQEFYGRDFEVTPDVLIPRPETELLVDTAVKLASEKGGHVLRACDVGTGSGCIAITLALEEPRIRVVGIDVSGAALEVARRNARRLECEAVAFLRCDAFTGLRSGPHFDLLISNPPYVSRKDRAILDPAVARYEPDQALFAGEDGLAFYKRILEDGRRLLRSGGRLVVELGFGLEREVLVLAARHGWTDEAVLDDFAGIPRCAVFRPGA